MAGPSHHPVHIHPARPLYRFIATGLGASMWFFVRYPPFQTVYKRLELTLIPSAHVPCQEGWPGPAGLEAPVGSLDGRVSKSLLNLDPFLN
jgi:hypothetical protein